MKKAAIALSALLFAAFAAIGAEPPPFEFLKARVDVEVQNGIYSYTIRNDEPAQPVAAFHLDIKEHADNRGRITSWMGARDQRQNVRSLDTGDEALMVPPGRSLGGFRIQSSGVNSTSTPYSLVGWHRTQPDASSAAFGTVLSPSN